MNEPNPRTRCINVRVSLDDYFKLEQIRWRDGKSMSIIVRDMISDKVKDEVLTALSLSNIEKIEKENLNKRMIAREARNSKRSGKRFGIFKRFFK